MPPIYVYSCKECSNTFEMLVSFGERDGVVCPTCQKLDTVERNLTAPNFDLQGSGFYKPSFPKGM